MVSSNTEAMTAPGSQPVDVLTDRSVQSDPHVENSNTVPIPAGTSGKPQARGQSWSRPGEPSWGKTTVPVVVRQ